MNDEITRELQDISTKHGGILKAEDVVEFARDPDTALHERFEWDDTAAAAQFRIQQARAVIRVSVRVIEETGQKVQAFVSLEEDRLQGGGYRSVVDVLSDDELRGRMLSQAKRELRRLQNKYRELEELTEVFAAIRKVA